jgi:hypothetical protein
MKKQIYFKDNKKSEVKSLESVFAVFFITIIIVIFLIFYFNNEVAKAKQLEKINRENLIEKNFYKIFYSDEITCPNSNLRNCIDFLKLKSISKLYKDDTEFHKDFIDKYGKISISVLYDNKTEVKAIEYYTEEQAKGKNIDVLRYPILVMNSLNELNNPSKTVEFATIIVKSFN